MRTAFLLMASYDGRTVIPLSIVCRDFFTHISEDKLQKKVLTGEIKLPIIRIEDSQKAARGVHVQDLADYIDRRRAAAVKEYEQIHGARK